MEMGLIAVQIMVQAQLEATALTAVIIVIADSAAEIMGRAATAKNLYPLLFEYNLIF
jgi:hypothetical protein